MISVIHKCFLITALLTSTLLYTGSDARVITYVHEVKFYEYRDEYYTAEQLDAMDFAGTPTFPADAREEEVLERINEYRAAAGLEPVHYVEELARAARAHAKYLQANDPHGISTHFEKPENEEFVGEEPWDRACHYGYKWDDIEEVIAVGHEGAEAVDSFMATVYHRLPFLNPVARELGHGYSYEEHRTETEDAIILRRERYTVLEVGVFYRPWAEDPLADVEYAVYPFPGQTDVPLESLGERPDPVPGESEIAGFPITVEFNLREPDMGVNTAVLTDSSGDEVDFWLLTYKNDPHKLLRNAVCILPKEPLEPNETYAVGIELRLNDAATFTMDWEFTTAEE
ncbi:MAG: CAP domain-containing protein [Candidatus Coatesbacteria bacterium]|nr:MAG: CAP domain-containing protein [Candidatus Coatesbacteria bacterium]